LWRVLRLCGISVDRVIRSMSRPLKRSAG
jgi:hypothetical protein